jgi:plastocyanin
MRRTRTCTALALLTLVVTGCGDSDDGGGGDAADCSPAAASLTVGALDELAFDAESYDADAGCIEVTYENEGSVAHTLLVDGESGFKLAVGDTDTGTIELDAGEYTLYCDVAGHRAAGMEATLTVS